MVQALGRQLASCPSTVLKTPVIHIAPRLRRRVPTCVSTRLAQRARRAGQVLAISPARWATLGLRIVDDAEMSVLHLRYMNEAGPTDVLSFGPPVELEDLQLTTLGDIVLDWDAILRQARGPSVAAYLEEATVLLVHGLAHLLGHDHRNRHEGRAMAELEARVLRRLGVTNQSRPYAPRLRAQPREESR